MTSLIVLNGCRTVQLTYGKNTLIDVADWPVVSRHNWKAMTASQDSPKWYARRSVRRDRKLIEVRLHRTLCDGEYIDHRNGDSLDNRRENLRACTPQENVRNIRASWGVSRFKGVCYAKPRCRWRASIRISGRLVFLGYFKVEADAARAYDAAAILHFGDFACTNEMMFGDY